jgi:hypothetical protein
LITTATDDANVDDQASTSYIKSLGFHYARANKAQSPRLASIERPVAPRSLQSLSRTPA